MGVRNGWNRWVVLLVSAAACAAPAGAAEPSATTEIDRIRLVNKVHHKVARRVVESASRRLRGSFCEAVVDDFKTLEGHPLRTTLADRNMTASEALDAIFFWDGGTHAACRRGALAFTSPRNTNVFLCRDRFFNAAQYEPALAEAIVIHELLHVLGLGENPPSSQAITARVLMRCSRS